MSSRLNSNCTRIQVLGGVSAILEVLCKFAISKKGVKDGLTIVGSWKWNDIKSGITLSAYFTIPFYKIRRYGD